MNLTKAELNIMFEALFNQQVAERAKGDIAQSDATLALLKKVIGAIAELVREEGKAEGKAEAKAEADNKANLKRTTYRMAVRQTSTATIYRTVMTDGERFFVRDDGRTWDVTDKKDQFRLK